MSRIDELLHLAIATGEIPAEARPEERAEIERLLRMAGLLRTERRQAEGEASSTMPAGRARFERFLAARPQPPNPAVRLPKPSLLSRGFHAGHGLVPLAAAAAIGLIIFVALIGSQAIFSSTEAAQALAPDDYVQLEGLVSNTSGSGAGRTLKLQSGAGPLTVSLSAETSILNGEHAADAASIRPGDSLLVGGVVAPDGRTIAASTIAVSDSPSSPPARPKPQVLRKLPPNLEGRVRLVAVSREGDSARVLIETPKGKLYLVTIDVDAAAELLSGTHTLGQRVRVTAGPQPGQPVFTLALAEEATSTPPPTTAGTPAARPGFVTVRGVITGRVLNDVIISTDRGPVTVVIRPATRRLLGKSGLTLADVGNPDAILQHTVVVTGGLQPRTGRIVADLIILGPAQR